MANLYFRFKEFIIHQHEGVFKVNTDGVLLGAWANAVNPQSILEIGSGTGVLAFMMAQKFPRASINSIDILPEAIEICQENIKANTPNFAHIKFICQDIKTWGSNEQYDLIISNPPFFEDNSLSFNEVDKIAKHSTSMRRNEWCSVVAKFLNQEGFAFAIYPFSTCVLLEREFEKVGLFMYEKCMVRPNENKAIHRVMYKLSKQKPLEIAETALSILQGNEYSGEFKRLTGAFYL